MTKIQDLDDIKNLLIHLTLSDEYRAYLETMVQFAYELGARDEVRKLLLEQKVESAK